MNDSYGSDFGSDADARPLRAVSSTTIKQAIGNDSDVTSNGFFLGALGSSYVLLRWTLLIPDSKTGVPVLVRLAQPVIDALQEYDWRAQKWLFGTRHRSNVARDIGVAAKKAGIDSYGSHALGRHSFATRLLNDGKSLEFVRKAGHWKTIKMVSERYGHLEQDDVSDAVRDHGAKWGAERAPIKTEGAAKKPKLVGK